MTKPITFTFTVTYSWWVTPYINTLSFLCYYLGTEPDKNKVVDTIMKGVHIK